MELLKNKNKNRTLLNMINVILIGFGLPNNLWSKCWDITLKNET